MIKKSDCPFCIRIQKGAYEAFARNSPEIVWFTPLNPLVPGHTLFVPVTHVETALEDPYTTARTLEYAARWSAAHLYPFVDEDDVPPSCNFITSVGEAATQSVRHLHIHVIPRRKGDGLLLPWSAQDMADQIREASFYGPNSFRYSETQ